MADTYGGHIRLDNVPYAIHASQWQRTVADRMAAKTGRGTTTYADQQNWDYYVHQDFSGGLGQTDETAPGGRFVVGDCISGGGLRLFTDLNYENDTDGRGGFSRLATGYNGTISIGSETNSDYQKIAFILSDTPTQSKFFVLHMMVVTPAEDVTVTWEVFEGTSSSDVTPTGSALDSGSFTVSSSNIPGLQYKVVEIDVDPAVGTNYTSVVLSCSTKFEIGYYQESQTDPDYVAYYDGSSWSTASVHYPMLETREYVDQSYISPAYFIGPTLGSSVYGSYWVGDAGKIFTVSNNWDDSGSYIRDTGITNDAVCWAQNDSKIYVGFGGSHQIRRYNGPWTTISKYASNMDIGGGYLWTSYLNTVSYTSDESTFTDIDAPTSVIALNFHLDKCYFLTQDGLWYVGSGDVPIPVVKGMAISSHASLYSWKGLLYILDDVQLLEFDGTTIRNISPVGQGAGLPEIANGTISCIYGNNHVLFVGVRAAQGQRSSILVYNGSGWSVAWMMGNNCNIHSISTQPTGGGPQSVTDTVIRVLTSSGFYRGFIDFKSNMPYPPVPKIWSVSYTRPSWVETPWIFASTRSLSKDWESISVSYTLLHDNPIRTDWDSSVYYKEEGETKWTLLGKTTHSNEESIDEYRFSDLDNRPSGARIRVGVSTQPRGYGDGDNPATTGVRTIGLDSIIIKYHAMLRDRYQWNLSIIVSDSLGLPSGKRHPYGKQEMIDHLDSLVKKQGPFIYTDVDGKRYEVKVLAGNSRIAKSEWKGGKLDVEYVYNITLDQVTTTEYVSA